MENNKLETISRLLDGKEIRSVWDSKKEDEKSELYTKFVQLKMKFQKDGKSYLTDALTMIS